jgi:hypothetical protein
MKRVLIFITLIQCSVVFGQELVRPYIPEMVSLFPNVRDIAISPNGTEIMFTAQSVMGNLSVIMYTKRADTIWSTPSIASFSGQFFDLEPFFADDGLKLYFVSTRALDPNVLASKDFDIWYVERSSLLTNWSEPINMGSPINTEHGEFYPSISTNGNFYFTRDNPILKRKDDIYMSTLKNGVYEEPNALSEAVNSEGYEYNAFIAPDESYLIYGCYNKEGGFGSGDLYISYKTDTGWEKAKNLGEDINSNKMDYCPFVDTKSNILYFTSKRDHTTIEHNVPLDYKSLGKELYKYSNGASRLYRVSLAEIVERL